MGKSLPFASSCIDLREDKLITLAQAAKMVPRRKPNPHTLFRWHKYGADGYRLETATVCRRRYTTEDALFAFLDKTRNTTYSRSSKMAKRSASGRQGKRILDIAGV